MKTGSDPIEDARFAMHARILRCPLGGNPSDCPLHDVRKLPVNERIEWLEARRDEEVVDLYRRHTACLACKLDLSDG